MPLLVKYLILGLVQGLTEFLPVSSSGHLVLLQNLFGINQNQVVLDIVLHLGTLAALMVFLFKDLKLFLNKRILSYLLLATAVTGVVVIVAGDFFEQMFLSAKQLIIPFFITAAVLLAAQKFSRGKRVLQEFRPADGFWLGLLQGISVIPGISRSGMTISALLFRGVQREDALKFSLLASIFAILGAVIFKLDDFQVIGCEQLRLAALGALAAFISGLLGLRLLLRLIRQARIYLFGYYCLALALALWGWLK